MDSFEEMTILSQRLKNALDSNYNVSSKELFANNIFISLWEKLPLYGLVVP